MCEVLDRVEKRGMERGIALGAEKKAKEITINLYKMGMEPATIAEIVNVALSKVQQWLGLVHA